MRKWFLSSPGMLDNFLEDIRKTISEHIGDGPVSIAVEPKKSPRSEQQHRLYRVWCRYFAENANRYMQVWDDELLRYAEQRMDEDAWHDLFRYAYPPGWHRSQEGNSQKINRSRSCRARPSSPCSR